MMLAVSLFDGWRDMTEFLSAKHIDGKVLDHLGLIAATIERLELIDKIDVRLPVSANKGSKVSMGKRVASMILNGLGFIDDRLYMFPEFLRNKPVDRLLGEGLSAEHFNDDVLGRALDGIYKYGTTKLFTEIAFDVGIKEGLLSRSAHFDTTTLSVYGEYEEEEHVNLTNNKISITHGFSKAHRPDLKQMVVNLATTGASGFPIWMQAHSGNASDKKVMIEAAEKMQSFCKKLKEAPSFLYVGDSAMYESCIKSDAEMKWLSRVPEAINLAKELVRSEDAVFIWKELENGYKICPVESTYGKIKQRWLVVHSEQAFARESKTLDKNIVCEKTEMTKTLWHLQNQAFKCEHDARDAGEIAVKKLKYHSVEFSVSVVPKHHHKGRPKKDAKTTLQYFITGTLAREEDKIAMSRRAKGRFILATNELDKSTLQDEDMLSEYKGQAKTESGFRFIKGNAFEVSSVFLKKPERIEALVMVMTLCLMVYSFAQHHLRVALVKSNESVLNQLKKPIQNPSMAWIYRTFHGIQLLYIKQESAVQELVINLTEVLERIIRYFGKRAERIYGLS